MAWTMEKSVILHQQIIHNNSMDFLASFIKSNYVILFKSVEILAALTGIFLLKKYKKDKAAKLFIYFLIYVNVYETIGAYPRLIKNYESLFWINDLLNNTIFYKNFWWYSLTWYIGSSVFYSIYFFKVLKAIRFKFLVKRVTTVLILTQLMLYIIRFDTFISNSITEISILQLVIIIFVTSVYFIELLNSDAITKFYRSLPFYVATAAFILIIIQTPLNFFQNYYNTKDDDFVILNRAIRLFSIMFMYLTYTIGLIVSKPEKS